MASSSKAPEAKKLVPKWLLYALLSLLWWGLFGFFGKIGSSRISPAQMQVLYMIGFIPILLGSLHRVHYKVATDKRGISYSFRSLGCNGTAAEAIHQQDLCRLGVHLEPVWLPACSPVVPCDHQFPQSGGEGVRNRHRRKGNQCCGGLVSVCLDSRAGQRPPSPSR